MNDKNNSKNNTELILELIPKLSFPNSEIVKSTKFEYFFLAENKFFSIFFYTDPMRVFLYYTCPGSYETQCHPLLKNDKDFEKQYLELCNKAQELFNLSFKMILNEIYYYDDEDE